MRYCILVGAFLICCYASAKLHFHERFTDHSFNKWVHSDWKGNESSRFILSPGNWTADPEITMGLYANESARFYAISRKFDKPFSNRGKDLIIQYTLKTENRSHDFCAGGYIKILPEGFDQSNFSGDSPYHIMFGPDFCGQSVSHIHLIFSKNGTNMLKQHEIPVGFYDVNKRTHLFTLELFHNNTYRVSVDTYQRSADPLGSGEWELFPVEEIDDPEDKKPEDWVDEPELPDMTAVKPDDWDEDAPLLIEDVNAVKPEEWNDEDDGEWVPAKVKNPDYKGPWVRPTIENPDYKGPWSPKQLPNPEYRDDYYAFDNIGGIGVDIWVYTAPVLFSNFFVTDSVEEAEQHAKRVLSEEFVTNEKKLFEELFPEEAKQEAEALKQAHGGQEEMPEDDEDEEENASDENAETADENAETADETKSSDNEEL